MSSYDKQDVGQQEELIDITVLLYQFFKTLRRLLSLVVALTLICAAGYWAIQRLSYTPQYTASAPFVVSSNSSGIINDYTETLTAEELADQFPQIINSSTLQKLVMEELGTSSIPGTITLEQVTDTRLVTLKVTSSDPQMAYDILQAVLNNYAQVAVKVMGSTTMTLLREPTVPTQVDNPFSDFQQLARGALCGLALGLLIVLVLTATRFTIKDKNDVKQRLNITYLSGIPQVPGRKLGRGKDGLIQVTNERVGFGFQESMRIARSRLIRQLGVEDDNDALAQKLVLVSGSVSKEGATTVAMNLALTMAAKGKRVILVDCNLRTPGLVRQFGLEPDRYGLADVLDGRCTVNDALSVYGYENLLVMAGSRKVSNAAEYIRRGSMGQLLEALRQAADFVILDTPPAGAVADASMLARHCDGVVVVIKQDYARVSRIVRAVENLSESGTPILGCVLTQIEGGSGNGYGYGYGYGYGGYGYGGYGYGGYGAYGKKRSKKARG